MEVEFNDASAFGEWQSASTASRQAFARCSAVGYLIGRTAHGDLTLAALVNWDLEDDEPVANVMRIPAGWTTKIRRLRCSISRSKSAASRRRTRTTSAISTINGDPDASRE